LLFHDLRRTAARNLRRAGIAEGVIQKIGGWKTRSVFARYAIVDQRDIADAMLKLQASEQKSEAVPQNGYSSATVDSTIVQVAKPQCLN
jgi:integrase